MVAPELARRSIALGVVTLAAVLQSVATGKVETDRLPFSETSSDLRHLLRDPLALPSAPDDPRHGDSDGVRLLGSELVVPVPSSDARSSHLHPTVTEPPSFVATYFGAPARQQLDQAQPESQPTIIERDSAPRVRLAF